mgnify:CR=1 FL=1
MIKSAMVSNEQIKDNLISDLPTMRVASRYLERSVSQRVARHYMEAKLFGLMSNHIGWQDLKRFQDQLQWMFKPDQHKVSGVLNRNGQKIIKIEAPSTNISISGFTKKDSGYNYRNLTVEVNGRVFKKTDDLEVVRRVVQKTLLGLGLRQ